MTVHGTKAGKKSGIGGKAFDMVNMYFHFDEPGHSCITIFGALSIYSRTYQSTTMFMKPSDIIGYWASHAIFGIRLDSFVAPPLDSGRLLIPQEFFGRARSSKRQDCAVI